MILTEEERKYLPIAHLASLLEEGVYIGKENFVEARKILDDGKCSYCKGIVENPTYSGICLECNRIYAKAKKYGLKFEVTKNLEIIDICFCCGKQGDNGRRMAFDHDHNTGEFRGTLCFNCNSSIGKLGDNLEGVLRAVTYLATPPRTQFNTIISKLPK